MTFLSKDNYYRKTANKWDKIPRADNPNKTLAEKAIKILSVAVFKTSPKGYWTVNHKYLTALTKCKTEQNSNILKQLSHIFDIKYFQSIIIEGRKYRNTYLIKINENTSKILKNSTPQPENLIEKLEEQPQKIRAAQDQDNIYIENKNIKYRSISNFKIFKKEKEVKTLENFYPLTEEEANELRRKSGREFNLNAINEILKNIAVKLKDRFFHSKKGFISYMSEILRYEKRQAVAINNKGFRIKANLNEEEKNIYMKTNVVEKYLTVIENLRDTSPEIHLKKKIACGLKPKIAYELLTSWQNIEIQEQIAILELRKQIPLLPHEKNLILTEIRATHERDILEPILDLKISTPVYKTQVNSNILNTETPEKIGIWGGIRDRLIKYLGNDGAAIDHSWFSRLESEIDEKTKEIKLKAPNSFFKDYIETKYGNIIERTAKESGFVFQTIYY